jgi:hypothetical protein
MLCLSLCVNADKMGVGDAIGRCCRGHSSVGIKFQKSKAKHVHHRLRLPSTGPTISDTCKVVTVALLPAPTFNPFCCKHDGPPKKCGGEGKKLHC